MATITGRLTSKSSMTPGWNQSFVCWRQPLFWVDGMARGEVCRATDAQMDAAIDRARSRTAMSRVPPPSGTVGNSAGWSSM
ncbi:hypothetical protein [Lichenicoccus sp.]|uniref:hypothetical protein n=1 Tax=Lichenicoccus sp. TaxID=2781899 RepID=UPI003D0F0F7D